jgi:hypothetical protein
MYELQGGKIPDLEHICRFSAEDVIQVLIYVQKEGSSDLLLPCQYFLREFGCAHCFFS